MNGGLRERHFPKDASENHGAIERRHETNLVRRPVARHLAPASPQQQRELTPESDTLTRDGHRTIADGGATLGTTLTLRGRILAHLFDDVRDALLGRRRRLRGRHVDAHEIDQILGGVDIGRNGVSSRAEPRARRFHGTKVRAPPAREEIQVVKQLDDGRSRLVNRAHHRLVLLSRQSRQRRHDALSLERIQTARRFIREDDARRADELHSQRQSLLFPAADPSRLRIAHARIRARRQTEIVQ